MQQQVPMPQLVRPPMPPPGQPPQPAPLSPYQCGYKTLPEEGECVLLVIYSMRKVMWRFVMFIILSILLAGIPALFAYWYIKFRRWLYYEFCPLPICTHFFIYNYDKEYTIVKRQAGTIWHSDRSQAVSMYFVNRYMRYFFNQQTGKFQAVVFDSLPRVSAFVQQTRQLPGYDQPMVKALQDCYGHCVMELPRPSCPILFVRQVLQPFYIFIVYSVILWYYQKYVYYASIILGTSIISIAINLYQVIQLNNKIYSMAYYTTPMHVLRSNNIMELSSIELVPGDIAFLKKAIKLPFDGVLLGGSVLINESALTGESVPIVKKAIDPQEFQQSHIIDKSSYVYEGTLIVQVCSYSSNPAQAPLNKYGLMVMVTKTNFSTLKGQLIRTISFPRKRNIRFYKEAAKFIFFLFCLAVVSYIILIVRLQSTVSGSDLALKFFDLITITVPPGLPASMSIGIIYSLRSLKKKKIYCISPDRIIAGGRVEHICFDKTGTLTEEFMDFYEFVPKVGNAFKSPIRNENKANATNAQILASKEGLNALNNMASCHSIMNLEGTQKLIGDPMEIKLFEFAGFQLAADSAVKRNYRESLFSYKGPASSGTVFRRFEFNSQLQRMTAIGSSTTNSSGANIFTKGAPEAMLKIMKQDTIPQDYLKVQEKYTSCGFRVLAMASKQIAINQIGSIRREEAESNLNFDGFEVFENKLKPETVGAIRELRRAAITVVIITGDNALTGANIGFKSGVIDRNLNAMIIDHEPNGRYSVKNFQQQNEPQQMAPQQPQLINGRYVYPPPSERVLLPPVQKVKTEKDFECTLQELPARAIQIGMRGGTIFCLTGAAFHEIFKDPLTDQKKQFIEYVKVFARTKPNDKTRAVVVYQSMGKITAMCGDGANDCGALKQADAGLSLSQAEASISSPFTSKIPNITAMIELIKECRGGLATNFSLFNIMALYSLIQYTSTVITEYYYGYPADLQYLYWDIACNFFFFLTIGYTSCASRLSELRPNDRLFSFSNMFCVISLFLIQLVGQFLVIILMAGGTIFTSILQYYTYAGTDVNLLAYQVEEDFVTNTYEVQSLFMFSNFMYIFTVMAFTIGSPWKRFFGTNPFFMIVLVFVMTYSILICVVPKARLGKFELQEFDMRWQGMLLGLGFAFGIYMYVLQKFVLQGMFNWLRRRHPKVGWL